MAPFFILALFKDIVGKQLTKEYALNTVPKGTLTVHFQGALK